MLKRLIRVLLLACLLSGGLAATSEARELTWSESGQLTSGQPIQTLVCPTADSCTALVYHDDTTAEYTFSPTDPARHSSDQVADTAETSQMACPSSGLCVFADGQGTVIAFDPSDPSDQTSWQASQNPVQALACASATACVLVDTGGSAQAFDPATLGSATATGHVIDGADWLACPSPDQCTVVGSGGAETFDPADPPQTAPAGADGIDGGTALLGVSCPSATECVAIDYDANALSFEPQTIGSPTPQPTGAAEAGAPGEPGQPLSITCPTTTDCIVVSDSGDAYQADPQTGTWTAEELKDTGLAAIACPSAQLCVSGDLGSRIYLGTPIASRLGAGYGTLTGVTALSAGVRVDLRCAGATDDRCVFRVALAAGRGAAGTAIRRVTVKPGTATVTLGLTRAAGRALAAAHRLRATLTVTQARTGFTAVLLRRSETFRR